MEREGKIFAHPKTYEFLKAALNDRKRPISQFASEKPKNLGILWSYNASLGTLDEGRVISLF